MVQIHKCVEIPIVIKKQLLALFMRFVFPLRASLMVSHY